jgi:hypothetical protein
MVGGGQLDRRTLVDYAVEANGSQMLHRSIRLRQPGLSLLKQAEDARQF